MENEEIVTQTPVNYYKRIKSHLQKQYPDISEQERATLCREVVFAPKDYETEIDRKPVSIAHVRENLANFIERDNAAKDFIPYSLDAQIADLIEQSSCETSSMNEYYRWVGATADIIRHTGDGEVTHRDVIERKNFINMSYDREAEILLCLALYQATNLEHNKEKIDILRFKLARLREMRSMVANTSSQVKRKAKELNELVQTYENHCQKLSKEVYNSFAVNLSLNIFPMSEDLDENYSHLDYLQSNVLYMMRMLEMPKVQNERTENIAQQQDTRTDNQLTQTRTTDGYER